MSELSFDDLTRQAAAAISRRRSLVALGGAGTALAALASPFGATAKKKKRDRDKSCKQLVGRCKTSWENVCDELNCEPAGRAGLLACCDLLKRRDIDEYNICVLGNVLG